eukprot:Selendium_serpulae@DN6916_c0_g1_i1.p1
MPRPSSSRIYIGNLPEDVRTVELEDCFAKYGRIRDIDIKYGRTSNGTAYAFIEYDDPHDADDAVRARDGYKFGDVRLRVEFTGEKRPVATRHQSFSSGPPKRSPYKVTVTNLPKSASWQDLKDHMRGAGPVGFANIEGSRGVVEYETREDMQYAIKRLDESEFRNPFHRAIIRVRAAADADDLSRSRSPRRRSNSRSPARRRASRSESRSRSSGRARDRSRSKSSASTPAGPAARRGSASRGASAERSPPRRSTSRGRRAASPAAAAAKTEDKRSPSRAES